MKIAVIGAGGIGGFVGAKFALAGESVTFIARGENLRAIRANGIRLEGKGGAAQVARDVTVTDEYASAGPQDVVVIATKAHQLAPIAPQVPRLFGPATVVVPMQNGIPYWYFHRFGGPHDGRRLQSVDPTGSIGEHIPPRRVIGCVVYPAAELTAPGVVKHIEGDRFPIGELDGATTERAMAVSEAFVRAGLKAPILDDIRSEIWLKLWGNLVFNPVSALSRATLAGICRYPPTRELAAAMMAEAQAVASHFGVTFRVPIEKRIAGAEKVGEHKTSMLQDVEAARPLEIDALLGSVVELARLTGTPTPHLDSVLALTKLLERSLLEAR